MDFKDAQNAYDARADVDLQAKIFVRLKYDTKVETSYGVYEDKKAGERIETTIGRIIFNSVLPKDYAFINHGMDKKEVGRLIEDCANTYKTPEMMQILDGLKALGFHYATRAGVTVSVYDATIPPNKADILAEADKKVAAVEEDYEMGFMSADERHRQIVGIWTVANEDVGNAMADNFDRFNPIYMMAFSGARGNIKQIRQLAGMRGLMADPKGEIIDRPIKANFREGLTVLEYFVSTHGSRKGMADTALRTADSGYLIRRLVDVAQDVIIHEEDCGTSDGIEQPVINRKDEPDTNLIGRCLAADAVDPATGEVVIGAGDYIETNEELEKIANAGIETVKIRSLMTCHAHSGVCQKCYGFDLAAGRPVNLGTAAGIIAAQSIGEPGTQLTMRTFHSGGVAGEDITQGLPRVTELFEARKPKGLAILAEISGTLQISATKDSRTLTIHNEDGEVREYQTGARAQLMPGVSDMCTVEVGQQLTKGSIDPHELLRLTDVNTTLRYIVDQVQDVYTSQGVDINDKHVEVIARQMLRKVTVTDPGSSRFLPGAQVNRYEFEEEVDRIMLEGGDVPTARPLILGITKASLATDSFLSAASFQETTKVLTDAAIEGKVDKLQGLKENVIIGKPIPAGTGLKRYRDLQLTYKGERIDRSGSNSDRLPDWAPEELRETESLLPQPQEWALNGEEYLGGAPGDMAMFLNGGFLGGRGPQLAPELAKLYLFDDLGVSQRWANKFSEAGIEMVGDLVGKTEDELFRIEGIGVKAIEELRAGLEARDLLYILDDPKKSDEPDASQLLEMLFSPEDAMYMGAEVPQSYSADPDDFIGTAPQRHSSSDEAVLNELLGGLADSGFGITDEESEKLENAQGDDGLIG